MRLWWTQAGVCLSAVILCVLGYHAIGEWQRGAALLAQRRLDAAVDLLVLAITRDMKGLQTSVLPALQFDDSGPDLSLDINGIGSAFARYPYPDVFFAAHDLGSPESMAFYSRSDRSPDWLPVTAGTPRFPVRRARAPAISRILIERLRRDVAVGRRFAAFDAELQGDRYQIVTLMSYDDPTRQTLQAAVGFAVNLGWVRDHYFDELVAQIMRIQGSDEAGISLAVVDDHGTAISGANAGAESPSRHRTFPLLFFDPILVALDPPPDLDRHTWIASATVAGDSPLLAARLDARRTLSVAAASVLVLVAGTILTVRAIRANILLMAMRSDFVSAVTHELKTPIATIRAVSETVASGRSNDPRLAREYAQLAVHETKRLTRLIDNLLAYARITDVTEAYAFEPINVDWLVRETLREFESQLSTGGFAVVVACAPGLPEIRGDRTSMILALGNVVDNSIRYSNGTRRLRIVAHPSDRDVAIEVSDAGCGIPPHEVACVTRRFFRGQGAAAGGSGLGLSIVQRIVADHSGTLSIQSELGAGTTVTLTLPQAKVSNHEEADSGR